MSFVSGTSSNEAVQKFLEILQNDFRILANETKKRYPQIKEVRFERKYAECQFHCEIIGTSLTF